MRWQRQYKMTNNHALRQWFFKTTYSRICERETTWYVCARISKVFTSCAGAVVVQVLPLKNNVERVESSNNMSAQKRSELDILTNINAIVTTPSKYDTVVKHLKLLLHTVCLGSTARLTLSRLFYPIHRPKRANRLSSGIKYVILYTAPCPHFLFSRLFEQSSCDKVQQSIFCCCLFGVN